MDILTLFIAGLAVGTVGGLLGIGGGVIIVPLLTIVFKYPVHEAVATSLAIVVANSIITSRKQLASGYSNLNMGFLVALFSVTGSIIGGVISVSVSAKVIYLMLGFSQILTVLFMWLKGRFKKVRVLADSQGAFPAEYYDQALKAQVHYSLYRMPPVMGVSAASGLLSGMVGMGGGVMIVPAMNIISRMPMKAATATSAFTMGFTAAGGGIIFFLSGYTNPIAVAAMVLAIYFGSRFAVNMAGKVNNDTLYKFFMVFLFLIACQMLYRGFNSGM